MKNGDNCIVSVYNSFYTKKKKKLEAPMNSFRFTKMHGL